MTTEAGLIGLRVMANRVYAALSGFRDLGLEGFIEFPEQGALAVSAECK